MNNITVSNGLDPDQDQHSVDPDLGPNCLQRLIADKKLQLARKELMLYRLLTSSQSSGAISLI